MCKETQVIPGNKVVDWTRIIGKKWRAEEEERHKVCPPQKKKTRGNFLALKMFYGGYCNVSFSNRRIVSKSVLSCKFFKS
jgi:hypothetical protein